jgi:divalent metal cation (Fe/Co/Zn/Cd) transporter
VRACRPDRDGPGSEAALPLPAPSVPSPEWLRVARRALGMALTATSLVAMPDLGIARQRLAGTLGSAAAHGEGAQNLLGAYLAGAVFLGLAGNALLGWWWLDPLAALLIAGVAVREGLETWQGEGCRAAALPPSA